MVAEGSRPECTPAPTCHPRGKTVRRPFALGFLLCACASSPVPSPALSPAAAGAPARMPAFAAPPAPAPREPARTVSEPKYMTAAPQLAAPATFLAPAPATWKLPNGLQVVLIEKHTAPLVGMTLLLQ